MNKISKKKKNLLLSTVKNILFLFFFILLFFSLLHSSDARIVCSSYRPRNDWSYNKVLKNEIFEDRNFLCRVFGIRKQCVSYDVNPNLKTYEVNAMNRYFISPEKKECDYSDFLKFLRDQWYFKYFCSSADEIMKEDLKLEPCPSILRYHFNLGIKDCPNRNLKLSKGLEIPGCTVSVLSSIAKKKLPLCKFISW
jgi:hypothetical protein